jgi:hypothetical protein
LQPDPQARFATAAEAGRALAAALRARAPLRRLVLAGTATTLVTALGLSIPAVSRLSGRQAAAQAEGPHEEKIPMAGIRVRPAPVAQQQKRTVSLVPEQSVPPANPKVAPNLDELLQAALDSGAKSAVRSKSAGKKAKAEPRPKTKGFGKVADFDDASALSIEADTPNAPLEERAAPSKPKAQAQEPEPRMFAPKQRR